MVSEFLTVEQKKENIKKWITLYRRNPHIFIQEYIGLKLYPYQILDLYAIAHYDKFAGVRARATAKSFEAGLIAIWRAVMYPNSKICIVSSTKAQAGSIIEDKIKPLYDKYENFRRECKSEPVANNNNYKVEFRNGSVIFVVPLKESARGKRATFIIYEEFRLLDKEKIDTIISPFKVTREAPFLKDARYTHLIEEAKEVYITSSGYDSEPWYGTINLLLKQEAQGLKSICFFADYALTIRHRIKTIQQIRDEMDKLGTTAFEIEYKNLLIRENKRAFFPNSLFKGQRTLKIAYYPQHPSKYNPTKNLLAPPISSGEIIIESVDFALKASANNDNTIITVAKLVPTQKGYNIFPIYIESMHGENSLDQALRIKQVWYDFNANYIVLDCGGAGGPVYDILTDITIDDSRGLEYPAMTAFYHKSISKYEDYRDRTRSTKAIPIIYPMMAGEAINSEMAYTVRDMLQNERVKLLCDPIVGEEYLITTAKYYDAKKDVSLFRWFMNPYYQTTALIGEMTALKSTFSGQLVRLSEPYNGRKDRYSSFGYLCYVVKIVFDPEIVKEKQVFDYKKQVCVSSGTLQTATTSGVQRFGGSYSHNGVRRKLFGR